MSWFSISLSKALAFFKGIFGSEEGKDFLIGLCATVLNITDQKAHDLWDTLEVLVQQAYANFPAAGTGQQKYDWVIQQIEAIGIKAKPFIVDYVMHQVLAFLTKKGAKV